MKKATNPASREQLGTIMNIVFTLFMGFLTGKTSRVEELKHGSLQEIIDQEDKASFINEFMKFLNNKGKMTHLVVQRILDLDHKPNSPFDGATHKERTGPVGRIELDFKQVKTINLLEEGETYITGKEFAKRLKSGGHKVLNSNMIDEIVKNQDEPDWQEWLEPLKGKLLFAFGDVFSASSGSSYIRCALWHDGRWVSDYDWLGNEFNARLVALVLADPQND